jgi:hypothetical protein
MPLTDEEAAIVSRFYAPFSHPSAVFNRRVLSVEELQYDPNYPHAEDFELFRRIARSHRIRVVTEKLLAIRRHGESIMTRSYWPMRASHYRIIEENLRVYNLDARPLLELLDPISADDHQRILAAAQFMRAVRDQAAQLDARKVKVYEMGRIALFNHVFETIRVSRGLKSAAAFVEASGEWRQFRVRERWLLKNAWLPTQTWMAMSSLDRIRGSRNGTALENVLPNYEALSQPHGAPEHQP